jgi:hypothetical protein
MSAPDAAPVSLSLVIPAYNEGGRLADGVSRLRDAVASGAIVPETTEFVVVDDGSTDDTTEQAGLLFAAYPHVRHVRLAVNRGKGGAVRAGVAVASAPVIAFADADMAIDPAQTPQFVRALATSDLAIGSRTASGSSVDRPSLHRSVMNRSFNRLVNSLTGLSLQDTQCGYKAFRAPVAKLLFHCTVTERFAFDVEILSLARRLGLSIAEIPVQWLRVKGSRIRPWYDARSMTRDVFRASRGASSTPPLPTLLVRFPEADDSAASGALRQRLAPSLPVLRQGDGGTLVFCPLMSETGIEATVAEIAAHHSGATIDRTELTLTQLCGMSPLTLTWDDDAVPDVVHRTPSTLAAGTEPGP